MPFRAVKFHLRQFLLLRYGLLAKFLPPSRWYWAALRISRFEAFVGNLFRPGDPGWCHAWMLHYWVDALRMFGPFPIPIRTVGMELVKSNRANGRGVLLCSAHAPLFELILTALSNSELAPDLVVSAPYSITDGRYRIPGTGGSVTQVPTGANSLLRIRSTLRSGGLVACMLDETVENPLSGNVLRLSAKVSATILFWTVSLHQDGVVDVAIEGKRDFLFDTEAAIQATLDSAEIYRAPFRPRLLGPPPEREAARKTLGRHA